VPADVLVTGAAGFVGRHLLDRARARGLEPAAAEGDLRDRDAALRAVAAARPRAVVHLASAFRRARDVWSALAEDVMMTANVLAAARELAPEAPILVAGSAAQYGLGGPVPLREDALVEPVSAYGAVKCVIERLCTAAPLADALRVVFTRSFNHVGPGQPLYAPVAAWARQVALAEAAGGGVVRTGRLDVRRDFLDVRDVADAYLDLVTAEDAAGVVNVCSGVGVELADAARRLVALAHERVELEIDPSLLRPLDPTAVVGDPSVLGGLTGFEPTISLDQSLADTLDEWRDAVARNVVAGRASQ
jgi:GDP-4-dehydro-6-deoxy-D-mannose reductase